MCSSDLNPSQKIVTLRRNATLADVFPCMALEDFDCAGVNDGSSAALQQQVQRTADILTDCQDDLTLTDGSSQFHDTDGPDSSSQPEVLRDLGLTDIDVSSCQASPAGKKKLTQLIAEYQSIFFQAQVGLWKSFRMSSPHSTE